MELGAVVRVIDKGEWPKLQTVAAEYPGGPFAYILAAARLGLDDDRIVLACRHLSTPTDPIALADIRAALAGHVAEKKQSPPGANLGQLIDPPAE